jgi:hypothetical protein
VNLCLFVVAELLFDERLKYVGIASLHELEVPTRTAAMIFAPLRLGKLST